MSLHSKETFMKKAILGIFMAMNMVAFANGGQDPATTETPVTEKPVATKPTDVQPVVKPSSGCGCGKPRTTTQPASRRSCKPR